LRTEKIEIRVTPCEKKLIQDMAVSQGINTTRFIKLAIYHWIYNNYSPDQAKNMTDVFIF